MYQPNFSHLTVTNLTVFLSNNRPLIQNLSFTINSSDKIAVIGEEGNGKSTLLKIIAKKKLGNNLNITGEIQYKSKNIGYLPQIIPSRILSLDVLQFMIANLATNQPDWSLLNNYHLLEKSLYQLNLPTQWLDNSKKIDSVSGGEQVRLYLAKILLHNPTLLLLDEPTNNLDLETISWLENFIKTTPLPILYVSHDLQLLQNTATHILHLQQIKNKQEAKHHFVKSNYQDYIKQRQQKIEWETKESIRQKKQYSQKITKLFSIKSNVQRDQNRIIDSSARRLLNKRMKTIISQQKKLENQELLASPDVEESIKINFSMDTKPNKNQKIINLSLASIKINQKTLLKNTNLEILSSDKICFIGPNGCGKSTLLKTIYQKIIRTGKKVGYFPQTLSTFFELQDYDSIRYVMHFNSRLDETTARQLLGQLKFTPEEMTNQPLLLSGGQQTKLILLCLSVGNFPILILDESTRNLSPLSLPAFINAIREFPGCIISASHDREFISRVGKINYQFKNFHLVPFSIEKT